MYFRTDFTADLCFNAEILRFAQNDMGFGFCVLSFLRRLSAERRGRRSLQGVQVVIGVGRIFRATVTAGYVCGAPRAALPTRLVVTACSNAKPSRGEDAAGWLL